MRKLSYARLVAKNIILQLLTNPEVGQFCKRKELDKWFTEVIVE